MRHELRRTATLLVITGALTTGCGATRTPVSSYERKPSSTTTLVPEVARTSADLRVTPTEIYPSPSSSVVSGNVDSELLTPADELFGQLVQHEEYAFLRNSPDRYSTIAAFQNRNGLIVSQELDEDSLRTLDDERKRLERPAYTYAQDATPQEVAAEIRTWTRQDTVDRLSQMNAFATRYGDFYSTRQDLLDPKKTKEILIKRLNELIYFAGANGIEFDLLIVNSGHGDSTLSGNRSQHGVGEAFDLGFRNNGISMNHTIPQPGVATPPDELLDATHNPKAYADAVRLLKEFFTPNVGDYRQIIAATLPYNLNRGKKVRPSSFGKVITDTHMEHMHVGVRA